MTTAWVIRAGRNGEREQWALQNGCSGGGWPELPDLTPYTSKEQIAALTANVFAGAPQGRINTFAGQLWALRGRIEPGNLMVLPLKTTRQIAFGEVTSHYTYLGDDQQPDCRHVVKVDWQVTDIPRSAVKQDLLYTLGSAVSIFAPSKNAAVARLEHLRDHRADPGAALPALSPTSSSLNDSSSGQEAVADETVVDDPEVVTDFEQAATDQITARIQEDFAGHQLAALVAAVLEIEGYRCHVSPPGPDGGIDISAGRGPLGLDSPRLLVQVKSGGQVGSPVVNQLQGVMTTYGAEQGLLVAWGGLSKQARDALRHQHLRIRVWESDDVVDAVLRSYPHLPESIKTVLPLKRVWVVSGLEGA